MMFSETTVLTQDHVKQLVALLVKQSQAHFWDVVAALNLKPTIVQVLLEREQQEGLISPLEGGTFALTAAGEIFAKDNRLDYADFFCARCNGKRVILELYPADLDEFRTIFAAKPCSSPAFDQVSSTPETAIRRALLMAANGDVANKSIVLLGDNDLISITLAQLGLAEKITVFELDSRIVSYIRELSSDQSLQIEVVEQDLRNPPPSSFIHRYDTFFTDQPYTLPGVKLFLSRGVEALREQPGLHGYFCLSDAYLSRQDLFSIQKMLVEMGVLVREIEPDFNEYEIPEYHYVHYDSINLDASHLNAGKRHWFRSSLIRLETTEETQPQVHGKFWEEYIYGYMGID